jgi:hypothetical protein
MIKRRRESRLDLGGQERGLAGEIGREKERKKTKTAEPGVRWDPEKGVAGGRGRNSDQRAGRRSQAPPNGNASHMFNKLGN